jgi:hypothetical protein
MKVPVPKNLQTWFEQLDALVEKLPTHEFVRKAIRNQFVMTVLLESEKFQQLTPEQLDELQRLNPHFAPPPQS